MSTAPARARDDELDARVATAIEHVAAVLSAPGTAAQGGAAAGALPNGVEVTVTLESGEVFTRIFALRGQ